MEETFLYHKLEAMRLVNEQIADPVLSLGDGCLSLIASLALVEVSGLNCFVFAKGDADMVLHRAEWVITKLQRHILTVFSH